MSKKWDKRTEDPGLPTIIFADKEKNTVDKDQVISFKSTTDTTELVDYNVQIGADGDKHIWKIGEKFNNDYFTIKHYTGENKNKYQDTGRYLTANENTDKEPTVKVKQGKKVCYLRFHIINYTLISQLTWRLE